MKKLKGVNSVSFKEDKVFLEDNPISIGDNIEDWLINNNLLEYVMEVPAYDENRKYIEFVSYPKVIISIYDQIIDDITIYPYQYQSSPYYKGDIFIADKKLEVPFFSDDIENYFLNIKIKPKEYFKRFAPRETVDYTAKNISKIEISMGRDPSLVSSLSLKAQ